MKREPIECSERGCRCLVSPWVWSYVYGRCDTHQRASTRANRKRKYDRLTPEGHEIRRGDLSGYEHRYLPETGESIAEHRWQMQLLLGRPLVPGENVHHRNGVRDDNRPENLELWYVPQPAGQRVPDLIAYIVEFHREALIEALEPCATGGFYREGMEGL